MRNLFQDWWAILNQQAELRSSVSIMSPLTHSFPWLKQTNAKETKCHWLLSPPICTPNTLPLGNNTQVSTRYTISFWNVQWLKWENLVYKKKKALLQMSGNDLTFWRREAEKQTGNLSVTESQHWGPGGWMCSISPYDLTEREWWSGSHHLFVEGMTFESRMLVHNISPISTTSLVKMCINFFLKPTLPLTKKHDVRKVVLPLWASGFHLCKWG